MNERNATTPIIEVDDVLEELAEQLEPMPNRAVS